MSDTKQVMAISKHFLECFAGGSRRTCKPPPTDTDDDWLVLAKDSCYVDDLFQLGFEHCGAGHYEPNHGDFTSWKKGELNLIVTVYPNFYHRFIKATKISAALNLMDKKDRITLFQGVLYGNVPPIAALNAESKV